MTLRVENHFKLASKCIKPMMALEDAIQESSLEHLLLELVKIRASQINGCAFCLHMHTTDARAAGESEMRIYMLDAWQESSLYSERERAALAWTETLTLIANNATSDEEYTALASVFTPEEQVYLTMAIGAINSWNRFQIGFAASHPVNASDVPA